MKLYISQHNYKIIDTALHNKITKTSNVFSTLATRWQCVLTLNKKC